MVARRARRQKLFTRAGRVHRWRLSALVAIVSLVGAVLAAPAGALSTVESVAGPTDPATFVACGYGILAAGTSPSCLSLPDAITAALATNENATIEMEPGSYCPIDLSGQTIFHNLTFVGIGIGSVDVGSRSYRTATKRRCRRFGTTRRTATSRQAR